VFAGSFYVLLVKVASIGFYKMDKRRLASLFIVFVFLELLSVAGAAEQSAEEQLAAAEARWMANKPQTYEFEIKMFCPGNFVMRCDPIVFRVHGGNPTLISGEVLLSMAYGSTAADNYGSVERQFEFIRQQLAKPHYRMEVNYDPTLGYPKRIFIDPERYAAKAIVVIFEGFKGVAR
jgi:hypothetical protein